MKSSLTTAQPRFAQRMRSRFVALATVAALGATAFAGALPLVSSTAAEAAAVCAAGNPLAPAQNFTVFVEENAVFGNAETEGSLAVGGKLSWTRDYPVIHTSGLTPTNYDLPVVNGVPVRVAAGALDVVSSNGQLKVTSGSAVTPEHHGHLQVEQVDWSGHWARGGGKELRLTESSTNQDAGTNVQLTGPLELPGAAISPENSSAAQAWTAANVAPKDLSAIFGPDVYDQLKANSANVAALASSEDENVVVLPILPGGHGGERIVNLQEGKINVINVDPDTFEANVRLAFGGAVEPNATTPLIFNVQSAGNYVFPQLAAVNNPNASNPNPYAPFILINYAGEGTFNVGGQLVSGSILAPNATVSTMAVSPIEGQIVAKSLTTAGGEIHHYAYDSIIPCLTSGTATGGFTVSKLLTGDTDLAGLPADYVINYSVDGVAQDALEVAAGDSASVSDLPVGSVVTLSEVVPADTADFEWAAPSWEVTSAGGSDAAASGNQVAFTVVEGDAADVVFTVTNNVAEIVTVPATGGFTVSKVLTGDTDIAGLPDEYVVNYTVDGVAQTPLEIAPGSPARVDGLPVGATVVMTEVAPVDTADFEWDEPAWVATTSGGSNPTISGNQVTLTVVEGDGSNVAVAVTNRVTEIETAPATGGFTVTKMLTGDTDLAGLPADYVINYSVDGVAQDALEVAAGDSASVSDLPVGSVVTLSEVVPADTADFEWAAPSWEVTSAGGSDAAASGNQVAFTVVEGDAADVVFTVTNNVTEIETGPATGGFTLSKILKGDAELAGLPDHYTVNYTVNGVAQTPLEIAPSTPIQITGLPVGASVVLEEVRPSNTQTYAWQLPSWDIIEAGGSNPGVTFESGPQGFRVALNFTVVEGDGTNVSFGVVNTVQEIPTTGGFTIAKALNNPDSIPGLPSAYTVEYQIDGGDWIQVSLTAGGLPVTVSGLEIGTHVAVRETTPAAIAGATWAEPVISDSSFTITAADVATPRAVTVTNEITEDPEVPSDTSFSTHAHTGATPNGELTVTNNVVTDHVYLVNPQAGAEYVLEGELVYVDGGQIIRTGITNSVTYIGGTNPADDSGVETFYSDFTLTPAELDELAGKKLFIFQYLYDGEGNLLQSDDATEAYSAWFETTNEWVTVAVDADTETPDEDTDGPDEGPETPGDSDDGGSGDGSGGGEGSGGGTSTGTPGLPVTGSNSGRIALFALMLLTAGGVAVGLSRRFAN